MDNLHGMLQSESDPHQEGRVKDGGIGHIGETKQAALSMRHKSPFNRWSMQTAKALLDTIKMSNRKQADTRVRTPFKEY
ncbi:MAG: hypothetical protein FRX49_10374 [Trebouxia sp. A1-2]|nr:MAG: hypothetical protein FRX49_10374 [Trebouxia sp. A1-2]